MDATWKLYELVNPSDPFTFRAPSGECAACAVLLLSRSYMAKEVNGEWQSPLLLFGDPLVTWQAEFGRSVNDSLEDCKPQLAEVFESFVLGSPADRRHYESTLELIDDPDKRQKFQEQWADRRSSMNDIAGAARHYAQQLRQPAGEATATITDLPRCAVRPRQPAARRCEPGNSLGRRVARGGTNYPGSRPRGRRFLERSEQATWQSTRSTRSTSGRASVRSPSGRGSA